MSFESNSDELRLAKQYKSLLSTIRPLIEKLDKSKDAQLCLLWLSKLDQCSCYEKRERNDILSELSRQVKSKCLEPPFNSQPPSGPLRNIVLNNSIPFWRNNDFSDELSSETTTDTKSPNSSCSSESHLHQYCKARAIHCKEKPTSKKVNQMKTIEEVSEDHSQCVTIQKKYHDRVASDQTMIKRYQEIIKSLITQKFEGFESKLKSMKSTYESKISNFTSSVEKLEEENNDLRQLVAGGVPSEKVQELESKNSELKEKVGQLETENNVLESKCQELKREKSSALSEFTRKLNESEKQMKENENRLKIMEKKYEDDLQTCRNEHQAEISELEKKYTSELSTLERILNEKQKEICNLREQVSTQCLHFDQEVLRLKRDILQNPDYNKDKRKIRFLRNKVKRLEKTQESMALAFQSQLEQLISRKDLIISTLEMKLSVSNSELRARGDRYEVDDHFNEKIHLLEAQYRELLQESENHAAKRRQTDLEKILVLENQLINRGLGFQEMSSITNPENLMLTPPNEIAQTAACLEESK